MELLHIKTVYLNPPFSLVQTGSADQFYLRSLFNESITYS